MNFLEYLDERAKMAKKEGKGFILQGNINAWLGSDLIPNDPHKQNKNGFFLNIF